MTGTLERFEEVCRHVHAESLRVCPKYDGRWFAVQLKTVGGLAAAKRLLGSRKIQSGFVDLVADGRHDLTVEHLATRPEFAELFSADEIAEARRRLGRLSAS